MNKTKLLADIYFLGFLFKLFHTFLSTINDKINKIVAEITVKERMRKLNRYMFFLVFYK